MTDESKALEVQKQEITPTEDAERTRECQCFVPRADVYETEEEIVVLADLPGVPVESIHVTLEKGVLTLNGYADLTEPEGYRLAYAEYEVGDFQRSFRLSDKIDQDDIGATFKDGVLRLHLPKAGPAKTRIIDVKAN